MSNCSLVIPVYRNADNIPQLIATLSDLDAKLGGGLEVVFVVDGSPDESHALLGRALPLTSFDSQLLLLSKNFGAFAAIREGLRVANGPYFAVMAADLQEPPELMISFFAALENEPIDVVYGQREGRADPWLTRLAASLFWSLYRRFVQRQMPPGGVDVFGCNLAFRDQLVALPEANSSLVGLMFWMGFRRRAIGYSRQQRLIGKSAWTLRKKLKYLSDSIFAFSDLPIRLMTYVGAFGIVVSLVLAMIVVAARLVGNITVPGYAATVVVISFFAALNSFGLGIIGSYVWRAFENTKGRPTAIVMHRQRFGGASSLSQEDTR
jgi:glycosyltransferase involved in cell wall biosynthesis